MAAELLLKNLNKVGEPTVLKKIRNYSKRPGNLPKLKCKWFSLKTKGNVAIYTSLSDKILTFKEI